MYGYDFYRIFVIFVIYSPKNVAVANTYCWCMYLIFFISFASEVNLKIGYGKFLKQMDNLLSVIARILYLF